MKSLPWMFALFLVPTAAFAHPLGDAAAQLRPGEWVELPTENMAPTMDTTNGGVPEYGDSGAWDPNTDRFFIHGQGHEGGSGQFRVIQFDAETNRWETLGQPAWYGGYPHQISHPYDHNTVDPDTGTYYMRPFQWNRIYAYNTAAEQWDTLPPIPDWGEYSACCGGLVHFPEMNALVLAASGEVVAYDYGAGSWSSLGAAPMGGYHNFAEYSPGEGAVLLGGGPDDSAGGSGVSLHRLDPDGSLTQLADAPVPLGTTAAVTTADPVSGVFTVLTDGGVLRSYDMATDSWGVATEDFPLPVFNTVAAPVSDHGVIMFANWDTGEPGTVVLMKMSPFTPEPEPPGGDETGGGSGGASSGDAGDDTGEAGGGDDESGAAGADASGSTASGVTDTSGAGSSGAGSSGPAADTDAGGTGCAVGRRSAPGWWLAIMLLAVGSGRTRRKPRPRR